MWPEGFGVPGPSIKVSHARCRRLWRERHIWGRGEGGKRKLHYLVNARQRERERKKEREREREREREKERETQRERHRERDRDRERIESTSKMCNCKTDRRAPEMKKKGEEEEYDNVHKNEASHCHAE